MGSSVEMRLHRGKNVPPLAAKGSVVRLGDKGEIGVQFGRLDVRESQRLEEYLLPLLPPMQPMQETARIRPHAVIK